MATSPMKTLDLLIENATQVKALAKGQREIADKQHRQRKQAGKAERRAQS